jgi:hypothetical protein
LPVDAHEVESGDGSRLGEQVACREPTPDRRSRCICSICSTPSAVVSIARPCASARMAEMIAVQSARAIMFWVKDLSILI